MADWILIPCLRALFMEFDRIAPSRDHTSDGSVGDRAHQNEVSDHNPDETGKVPIHDADHINEVHAIDVDNNLNESDLTMEKVVQFLLARCRSGAEKRLRYIIYNRRIWSASSGWVQKTYTGASPHTEHAHFSASYDSNLEASTASWHLEDIPVALTAADKSWILATVQQNAVDGKELTAALAAFKDDFLAVPYGNAYYAGRTVQMHYNDVQGLRDILVDPKAAATLKVVPGSNLDKLLRAVDKILGAGTVTASAEEPVG
jgi:hypothetical protein